MTKEKYIQLKEELKVLAKDLKELKPQFKDSQHEVSRHELTMSPKDYYWDNFKNEEWKTLLRPMRTFQDELIIKKREYRAKHILYSLERGKSFNQIESKVKKSKEYDQYLILSVFLPKHIKEYGFDKLDLLPNRTLRSMGWIELNGQRRLFTREEMRG